MKTSIIAPILFLCSCPAVSADLDIREITPDKVEQLAWKIEVFEREGYVQFTLQPPARLLADGRTAHLGVWHDRQLITSCILGFHKRKDGDRYEFAVSTRYLKDSTFELGPKARAINGESYRVYLRKFLPQKPQR